MRSKVSLAKYSTMRLGGEATYLCDITDAHDIPNALDWAESKKLPVIMIGTGSNIVWSDKGYDGLVLVNKIKGVEFTKVDSESSYLQVGAGENWDEVVAKSVHEELSGIEALSLIPGTVGATPVQNVGAYGQEVADTLVSVDAYDTKTKTFVTILNEQCEFGYRTSRFKTADRGRYLITSLKFHLTREMPKPPFYNALQKVLDEKKITSFTPQLIRDIVIAIRSSKLPDPKIVANNGSFFANPIVSKTKYENIKLKHDDLPGWPTAEGKIKIPAAWLIEKVGYKNFHDKKTGMATWHLQPLVLVNEKATHTADLILFRDRIIKDVHLTFDITLEQEPELI
ncbi:MAG: UDP-N-acetylmuramate dehydrogenase [Patescibacteria group bacterium]|nr:UDP-N-acetylmuramate dehydrogenase [Patescibacteria group bacterium]